MKQTATLKRLNAVMKDINGDNTQILRTLQDQIDYLREKVDILEEIIVAETAKEQPAYSDEQKRRLAHRGRKPISPEIIEKILFFNERNPSWGYDRIAGTMRYLGYDVSATTVRKVLNDHGIVPDPERRKRGDRQQFIETQQYVTAATDFATVERVTEHGLVREHLLFLMDIGSREVRLGGIAHNPDSNWTTQIARNMCDEFVPVVVIVPSLSQVAVAVNVTVTFPGVVDVILAELPEPVDEDAPEALQL